jgi:hypothetical protein
MELSALVDFQDAGSISNSEQGATMNTEECLDDTIERTNEFLSSLLEKGCSWLLSQTEKHRAKKEEERENAEENQ